MSFLDKISGLFKGKSESPAAKSAPAGTGAAVADKASIEDVIYEDTGEVFLPPCQIGCPLGADIQRSHVMLANVLAGDEEVYPKQIEEIGSMIYGKNPLFQICGYVCGICEEDCNYSDETGSVRRRMLERFVGDEYAPYLAKKAAMPKPTGEKVAVVGGGPSGLVCAYELGKRGYKVTLFEKGDELGGALRWIPIYRLPADVLNNTIDNLIRIANVEVKYGVSIGDDGNTLDDLTKQGYKAVYIATGKPIYRPLTYGRDAVQGTDLEGCMFGMELLYQVHMGKRPDYKGKKVIVVGGGNVAFDVARTARRLGADVSMVCLENDDKTSKDGIPADIEEIEGAEQEGITINYTRGVKEIVGENGKFKKIVSPKCTSLFDDKGFNPKFDESDVVEFEGDELMITIGQGNDNTLFDREKLFNADNRIDINGTTLMSNIKKGVFIGGDVYRVGLAAEAMRDGRNAAESIDRYIRGVDLEEGRAKEKKGAAIPLMTTYKRQPDLSWVSPDQRLNFDLFENGFSRDEAREEALRCLYCGPCKSCKACVLLDLQAEIYDIDVNLDLCGRCGVCVAICPYEAPQLVLIDDDTDLVIDVNKCKRCGVCVAACPAGAISINDEVVADLDKVLAAL